MELLDLVKSNIFLSSSDLLGFIKIIPLKFIYFIKIKINSSILNKLDIRIKKHHLLFKYFNDKKIPENEQKISSTFHIEEVNDDNNNIIDILNEDYEDEEEKYICENLIMKLLGVAQIYKNKEQLPVNNNEIYLYKINFIYPKLENIFIKIIYDYMKNNNINLNNLLPSGGYGGFFELLVNYYCIKNKKISPIIFSQVNSVYSFVPFNFSVKYYLNPNIDKEFPDYFKLFPETTKKIKIKYETTFVKQLKFNGKYIDSGLLIPYIDNKSKEGNEFILIVFQITTNKPENKRFIKDIIELILAIIKLNLENIFDIKIVEGYFFYILSSDKDGIMDKETVKFCK